MTKTMTASPQTWNPIAAAAFGCGAFGLLVAAGRSCSFLTVSAKWDETLTLTDTSEQYQAVSTTQGVFCDAGYYDLTSDPMWTLSRVFLAVSIVLVSLSTIACFFVVFCVTASLRAWKLISGLSALSALFQVPVFIIFQVKPCSQYEATQTCIMSIGSYLLVGALLATITITLITQLLDPPISDRVDVRIDKKEQDTDSSMQSAPSDTSFFSQLRACHGQFGINNAQVSPEEQFSSSSDLDAVHVEEGLCRGCLGASLHQPSESTESTWQPFQNLFDVRPVPVVEPTTRPQDQLGVDAKQASPIASPVVSATPEKKQDKSSIFREPVLPSPDRSIPSASPSKDPPGKLASEEPIFFERSFSVEGGKPASRRGKVLRGYTLFDEQHLESCFPVTPPLEIVTVQQMDQNGFDNDDDSINLGFGVTSNDDDDLMDYWKSINELPTTTSFPSNGPSQPVPVDWQSELDRVFGTFDPELPNKEIMVVKDPKDEELKREKEQQEIIVAEVLRRRGGRTQKKRRRKKSCSNSVASSPSSLLDVTIEEETAEDLLESESEDNHASVDPYNANLLVRTYSAPNLFSHARSTTAEHRRAIDCEHITGLHSHHLVETWQSGAQDDRAEQPHTVRFGLPQHSATEKAKRHVCFVDDSKTYSSDPTERTRRARIARIRRLQHQNRERVQTLHSDPSIHRDREPRATVIEDIVALQLIEASRPKDCEYGPDEASL